MKFIITTIILIFSLSISIAQKPKFKDVTKEELLKKSSSIDSTANAEYLFKGCEVSFDFNKRSGSFDIVYRHHQRIKIYESDDNKISNFSILYYKGENKSNTEKIDDLEAYTFNFQAGEIVKEKLSKDNVYDEKVNRYYENKKFAFPAITDGSVIEVKYTHRSRYYFNINEFYFQSDIPVKQAIFTTSIPEYFNYNVNTKGLVELGVTSEQQYDHLTYSFTANNRSNLSSQEGGNIQTLQDRKMERVNYSKMFSTYKATNVPAIKNEPYVYTMDNYKSSIKHELLSTKYPRSPIKYYTKTWDDIAELLEDSNNFGGQLNNNYREYNKFIDSVAELDTLQKIQKIFQAIKSQYTWNGYLGHYTDDGIKKMIKSGSGNIVEINLLLVNLLRKAGLEAHPMVSRESQSGFLNITNPSISQLNYVTGIVKVNGKYIYLDASEKNLAIDALPKRALNMKGIIINGKKGTETWMENPNIGKENRIYSLSIDGKSLKGIYKQTIKNYAAYITRKSHIEESDFISSLDTENNFFTNVTVENYDNLSDIKVVSDVRADGFIQQIDGKIFVDLQISDAGFVNPFKSETRGFSIFFDNIFSNVDMLKIKIPEGYKIENIPESLNIATPDKLFTIMVNFSVVNGEIAMTKKTKLSEAIINPSYYEALQMVYNQLEAKMKEKIVLAKI